jgi:hypothetical protein
VPSVVAKLRRASPMTADTFTLLTPVTKGQPEGYLADVARLYREEVADLAVRG